MNVARKLLLAEDGFATVLLTILTDLHGTEALSWSPETIRLELQEAFAIVELPKHTLDKIMAGIAVITTDYFFHDPARFIQLANILSGDDFDPTVFDPADSAECAWAITEAYLLNPWEEGEEPFAPEIQAYVGHVLNEEGFVNTPAILSFAMRDDLSEMLTFEYEDDPEMFQAIYDKNESKAAEIDAMIRDNLALMVQQLEALPLRDGNAGDILSRIKEQAA